MSSFRKVLVVHCKDTPLLPSVQLFPKIIHYSYKLVAYKSCIYVFDYLRRYVPRFAKSRARLAGLAKIMLLAIIFAQKFKVAAVAALVALASVSNIHCIEAVAPNHLHFLVPRF